MTGILEGITETLGAVTKISGIHAVQNPNGSWSLVGKVPFSLAYTQQDGSEPTDKQRDIARHCGPGFAKLKTRSWPTRDEAIAAASN